MKSSYKRLGDYIHEVNIRNKELHDIPLLGVSITKKFISSIANIVGTNMATYKLIEKNQFAYGPVTSRNGDKISIALSDEHNNAMVSQAYTVFDVNNANEVLPEYLMMWFRRPEFDRYARFMSHGSAREIFSWAELCDTLLPIPSIEKQREIVKEYNVIQNRITLNNQLIAKLEETAQTIYKQWFVDFEFPNSPPLEGCPQDGVANKGYKSSGGKMVWCEELEKEIPVGWTFTNLLNYSILSQGIQVEVEDQFYEKKDGMNRFLRIIDYTPNTIEQPRYINLNDIRYYCSSDDIAMIRYGDAGTVCRRFEGIIANNLFKIMPILPLTNNFLFYFLKEENIQRLIRTSAASSTMPAITHSAIKELPIVLPKIEIVNVFDKIIQKIENNILLKINENQKLEELNELLLARMTKVESLIETLEN
uniref:restriction endonuclease subunit S n=1 Tax=Flavobacterium sp. TaxID=239 RepID=UPI00404A7321